MTGCFQIYFLEISVTAYVVTYHSKIFFDHQILGVLAMYADNRYRYITKYIILIQSKGHGVALVCKVQALSLRYSIYIAREELWFDIGPQQTNTRVLHVFNICTRDQSQV